MKLKNKAMSNYDDDVLGVGNSQHPSNQEPEEEVNFESNDLQKCLDYYKDTGDIEPLENAICRNELIHKNAIEDLTSSIKFMRNNDLNATADFFCKLRDTF